MQNCTCDLWKSGHVNSRVLKFGLLSSFSSVSGTERSSNRIRTIADLESSGTVRQHHIMEAIGYRNLARSSYFGSSI